MASPLVSVVVRTRNRPSLLREALDSLRAQTFTDFETLLVNDGGERPPDDALHPAPGVGLTLLDREPPHGRAIALNAGLDAARGRYIAYLDDDDLFRPEHLETMTRFLSGSDEYHVVYGDVEQIEQTLGEDGRYRDGRRLTVYGRPFDAHRLLSSNYIPLIGLVHRRTEERYDPAFDVFEDWDFLIRLAERWRFHRIERITATYRVRNDLSNATTTTPWRGEGAESARRKLFEKHWGRQTVASQMALVDSLQGETWLARADLESLGADHAAAKERSAAQEARIRTLEDELRAFRGDLARQLQAAGEREGALRRETDAARATLGKIYASATWRFLSRYWRLKALLRRS